MKANKVTKELLDLELEDNWYYPTIFLVNNDYCQFDLTTGQHLDLLEKPASVNNNDESDYSSNSSYESGYGFDYFENF